MADETKVEDDFLAGLRDSGETEPLDQKEEDPFASLNKEEAKVEVAEEKEEVIPFNKDPKILRFIEKEVARRIPQERVEEKEVEVQDDHIDKLINSFTKIIGNDTPEKVTALADLKEALANSDERAAQKAYDRLDEERQAEVAIEAVYDNKLSDGFDDIEEETGVDLYAPQNKKLRIQFIDFIEKVAPKEDGEISELPDIGETFKAFVATKRSSGQTQKSKDLASHSMERSDGTATEAPTTGRLTWDNVGDKIRDRLGM